MPFFEGLMIAGMVAGATVNTLNDSFANVEDTCRQVTKANDKLTKMQDKWQSIFNNIGSAEAQLENWQGQIETQGEVNTITSELHLFLPSCGSWDICQAQIWPDPRTP